MINKLISKSQVRVLSCENCPSEDYARGYARAISDVLDLATIPTLGADSLEKIRAEIQEKLDTCKEYGWEEESRDDVIKAYTEVLKTIDRHTGGDK